MPRKGCPAFSGWPEDGLSYCDHEVGPDGTHEGIHSFPHHSQFNPKEDSIMELSKELTERAERAIKGLQAELAALNEIVAEMEGKKPLSEEIKAKLKAAGIGHPEIPKDEKPTKKKTSKETPVEEPKKDEPIAPALKVGDITIEKLRELATKYAEVFGMEKLLALNAKHGSSKKISGIAPEMYGVVYGAMDTELAAHEKAAGEPEAIKKAAETLSLELVRPVAAQFIAANGEPAFKALIKAFGAEKLSQVPPEKYTALVEAMNA